MNVAELIQSVKRQFGDETGAQITDDDIIRWINEGQLEISRRTEALHNGHSYTFSAGAIITDLPADFFKVTNVSLDTGKSLQFVSMPQLLLLYPELNGGDVRGTPKFFTVTRDWPNSLGGLQSVLAVAPAPSSSTVINVTYVSRPEIVTGSSTELSIAADYHNTLLTYCIAKAKQLDGDMDGYTALRGDYKVDLGEDIHDARHLDAETYPFIRASSGD